MSVYIDRDVKFTRKEYMNAIEFEHRGALFKLIKYTITDGDLYFDKHTNQFLITDITIDFDVIYQTDVYKFYDIELSNRYGIQNLDLDECLEIIKNYIDDADDLSDLISEQKHNEVIKNV